MKESKSWWDSNPEWCTDKTSGSRRFSDLDLLNVILINSTVKLFSPDWIVTRAGTGRNSLTRYLHQYYPRVPDMLISFDFSVVSHNLNMYNKIYVCKSTEIKDFCIFINKFPVSRACFLLHL